MIKLDKLESGCRLSPATVYSYYLCGEHFAPFFSFPFSPAFLLPLFADDKSEESELELAEALELVCCEGLFLSLERPCPFFLAAKNRQ